VLLAAREGHRLTKCSEGGTLAGLLGGGDERPLGCTAGTVASMWSGRLRASQGAPRQVAATKPSAALARGPNPTQGLGRWNGSAPLEQPADGYNPLHSAGAPLSAPGHAPSG
jgi:hypothetical protein